MHSSNTQFELSKKKSFPNNGFSFRVLLEYLGIAIKSSVYLEFSQIFGGVSHDIV